jgi:hypothetical protein
MPGAAPFEPPIAIQQPAGPQAAQAHILAALALLMQIALLTALAMLRTAGRFRLSINRRRKAPRAARAPNPQPVARPAPAQRRRTEPTEILLPETQTRIRALLAALRIEGAAALAATAPAPQSATPPAASRRRRDVCIAPPARDDRSVAVAPSNALRVTVPPRNPIHAAHRAPAAKIRPHHPHRLTPKSFRLRNHNTDAPVLFVLMDQPLMPRPNPTLDRSRHQRVNLQLADKKLQHLQRRLLGRMVRGNHLAGQRIGGLAQPIFQRIPHQLRAMRQPVRLAEQGHRGIGRKIEIGGGKPLKHRQRLHQRGHHPDLAVSDPTIGGGRQNHGAG